VHLRRRRQQSSVGFVRTNRFQVAGRSQTKEGETRLNFFAERTQFETIALGQFYCCYGDGGTGSAQRTGPLRLIQGSRDLAVAQWSQSSGKRRSSSATGRTKPFSEARETLPKQKISM
jgi:hypothetical protein